MDESVGTGAASRAKSNCFVARVLTCIICKKEFPTTSCGVTRGPRSTVEQAAGPPHMWTVHGSSSSPILNKPGEPACARAKSAGPFKERPLILGGTLRKRNRAKTGSAESTEIRLVFRAPYDWQTIIRFYQSHPIPGVERVTGDSFERVFRVGNTIGFFRVQPMVNQPRLKLRIVAPNPKIFVEVVRRVRKMFDLDSDPVLIANC